MKILVTGGTGLIGAELVRQLLDEGADVRILRRETSPLDLLGEAAHRVEHAVGDVTDFQSLRAAAEGVEAVYHTAAYLGFSGRNEQARLHRVNVEGTANVVDAAREAGVRRLVHTSSMAAFGRPAQDGGWLDERSVWQPSPHNTAYAVSKYRAELEVHRAIAEGLDAVLVNPALVFGPARPGENTRRIVERIRDARVPGVPAGGTNVVDWRDVAEGHRRAMRLGRTGERYFLGSENLTWREIMATLAEAFGVEPPRRKPPQGVLKAAAWLAEAFSVVTRTRPVITRESVRISARHYFYDNRKAVEELGCTFRPFAETARDLAANLG